MPSTTVPAHRDPVLALRVAGPDDRLALAELASLDEARPATGEVLLGVLDGRPVAALELASGRVLADPFVATREVEELLRRRASHLAGPRPSRLRSALVHLGRGERRTAAWVG